MTEIKVCGVRRPEDAALCIELGVSAIGLNFWPLGSRVIDIDRALEVVAAAGDMEVVAVFVDANQATIESVRETLGVRWVQLHGQQTPSDLEKLQPFAYKAVALESAADVARARQFGGDRLLVDGRGEQPGGTGNTFDWSLAQELVRERELTVAGGLRAENVGEVIRMLRPARVDVATGSERAPGVKDRAVLEAFVEAVRKADG